MSTVRKTIRYGASAAFAAFLVGALASSSAAFQRPPPAKEGGLGEVAEGCLGHGKGQILMPSGQEYGRMSGYLLDCEGVRRFKLEALLTGCIPEGGMTDPGYGFGGLYGKVWKLGGGPEPWVGAQATYGLDGTWRLLDETVGTFAARATQFTETGRLRVVGDVYGKFFLDPDGPIGATVKWGDAALPGIAKKPTFGEAAATRPEPRIRYRDAESGHKAYGKTPFGDAVPEPTWYADAKSQPWPPRYRDAESGHKGPWKTPFGEARSKVNEVLFGDARSAHKHPENTPFGDARSVPFRDAASEPGKDPGKSRFRDAASEPIHFGDAASVPRKTTGKSPYGEAGAVPFGDAASEPSKDPGKSRFRDAASEPQEQAHGCCYLRFRFDV